MKTPAHIADSACVGNGSWQTIKRLVEELDRRYVRVGEPERCRHCLKPLDPKNVTMADGCNSQRGVNHGLVSVDVCTCEVCDPKQTGASRVRRENLVGVNVAASEVELLKRERDGARNERDEYKRERDEARTERDAARKALEAYQSLNTLDASSDKVLAQKTPPSNSSPPGSIWTSRRTN